MPETRSEVEVELELVPDVERTVERTVEAPPVDKGSMGRAEFFGTEGDGGIGTLGRAKLKKCIGRPTGSGKRKKQGKSGKSVKGAAKGVGKAKRGVYVEPVGVSLERVEQLAREGLAVDGREEVPYERMSPPMGDEVRGWLEQFPRLREPAGSSILLLWDKGRVVYVGKSSYGMFGTGIAGHVHGPGFKPTVESKVFDAVSLVHAKDELLEYGVGALTRLLKPKYNRRIKRTHLDDQDREVLKLLGFEGADSV